MAQQIHEIPRWPVDDLYRRLWEHNNNIGSRYGAVAAFVLGGVLTLVGAFDSLGGGLHLSKVVLWGLMLVAAGAGLRWLSRTPPEFVLVFRNSADQIVWFYITTIHVRGAVSGTRRELNICLADRRRVTIQVDDNDADAVLYRFSELVPEAAVGYSVENRMAFSRDPLSLRRPKGVWRYARGLPG